MRGVTAPHGKHYSTHGLLGLCSTRRRSAPAAAPVRDLPKERRAGWLSRSPHNRHGRGGAAAPPAPRHGDTLAHRPPEGDKRGRADGPDGRAAGRAGTGRAQPAARAAGGRGGGGGRGGRQGAGRAVPEERRSTCRVPAACPRRIRPRRLHGAARPPGAALGRAGPGQAGRGWDGPGPAPPPPLPAVPRCPELPRPGTPRPTARPPLRAFLSAPTPARPASVPPAPASGTLLPRRRRPRSGFAPHSGGGCLLPSAPARPASPRPFAPHHPPTHSWPRPRGVTPAGLAAAVGARWWAKQRAL